jgi:putative tributyrin esterase
MRKIRPGIWLVLFYALTFGVFAQNAPKFSDFKLNSKLMSREMPYRVILPAQYNQPDDKKLYPVIYLLHGLFGHFDNWTDKTQLVNHLGPYNFIVVMPEGNDGWYTDSATLPNDKYESYIIQELIPEIDKNFRTNPNREGRMMAGLSMGGYGSIKFGLKYPDKFILIGSFSGALGAASWNDKLLSAVGSNILKSIPTVYGEDGSQTRLENDIFKLVKDMPAENAKKLPFIYLDCGTEDFLFSSNREFSDLLAQKKISHEYRQRPGTHNWIFWNAQVQEFLRLAERTTASPR